MAEDQTYSADPLQDRAQVRIFTLADYVAEERSGKLYISGAGLEWTGLPTAGGKIQSCYLVVRLAYPKASARPSHTVTVRVVDGDGNPAGPDPLMQAEMKFDLKRVPEYFTEVSGTLPIHIAGYPLGDTSVGLVFLNLLVDGVLISQLPVGLSSVDS